MSLLLRYLGYRTLMALCEENWDQLFGSIPTERELEHAFESFSAESSLTPYDLDQMLRKGPDEFLLLLPDGIQKQAWRRKGLYNWSRATFWIGILVLGSTALRT